MAGSVIAVEAAGAFINSFLNSHLIFAKVEVTVKLSSLRRTKSLSKTK